MHRTFRHAQLFCQMAIDDFVVNDFDTKSVRKTGSNALPSRTHLSGHGDDGHGFRQAKRDSVSAILNYSQNAVGRALCWKLVPVFGRM